MDEDFKRLLRAAKQMRRAYVQLTRHEFSVDAKDIVEVANFNKALVDMIKKGKAT